MLAAIFSTSWAIAGVPPDCLCSSTESVRSLDIKTSLRWAIRTAY